MILLIKMFNKNFSNPKFNIKSQGTQNSQIDMKKNKNVREVKSPDFKIYYLEIVIKAV